MGQSGPARFVSRLLQSISAGAWHAYLPGGHCRWDARTQRLRPAVPQTGRTG